MVMNHQPAFEANHKQHASENSESKKQEFPISTIHFIPFAFIKIWPLQAHKTMMKQHENFMPPGTSVGSLTNLRPQGGAS